MSDFLSLILIVLLFITGVVSFRWYMESAESKKELLTFLISRLDAIVEANVLFARHLELKNGYFTHGQLVTWEEQHENLFNEISGTRFGSIGLTVEQENSILLFLRCFSTSKKLRDEFNQLLIAEDLKKYNDFFDSVEGRKLDLQQRTAIVTDEDNNLVIAGAGSGKTTTIVGKVKYLIDRYKIPPQEILLISFTNKSTETLVNRIGIAGVEAKTFHKLGKDIIEKCEGRKQSIFEQDLRLLFKKFFNELIQDEGYLGKVTNYFTGFLKEAKSQFEFENHGKYIQYIKDQNFRTYKVQEISYNDRVTYKMEIVKSIEECQIANFLYFNGIDYQYEYPYEFDTASEDFRQYKPDFTITQNGKKVYLEHCGVSRDGNVPVFFAKEDETIGQAKKRYWDKIEWTRKQHKDYKTTLIETFSYEKDEDVLFHNLTQHLTAAGIMLQPKSPEAIWNIIGSAAQDEVQNFMNLFATFISLMKANGYTINDVTKKNNQTSNPFSRQRNALFIEIIKPIYERYQNYLSERGEIDFDDMISKASSYVLNGNYKHKLSYIIIDEFQDISISRYQLVNALKKTNPGCKLFCVGDDWQSIYRFSGSDIALFNQFEQYFGFAAKSKIETTYRFHNPVMKLSSDFIQKNPLQVRKELKSPLSKTTSYQIHYNTSENQDDTESVQLIFDELIKKYLDIEEKEIYILGRYKLDFGRLKNSDGKFEIDHTNQIISYNRGAIGKLKAQFMTVHKSKGLEADIVIVLNCNSGKYGFPTEMMDDKVLSLLLSSTDHFENEEERRVFYVAMTRAKESVHFIVDKSFKSKFIVELEGENKALSNKKCPRCKSGEVVLRKTGKAVNGNNYKFYGCTNYPYGCDYTKRVWEDASISKA